MKSRTKGIFLTIALSFAVCGFANVALAGVETDPNLNKLEMKFFQHDYAKDDVDARLDRLEKLVFGEAKTGDDSARLANLVAAVGPNLDDVANSSSGSGGSDAGSNGDGGSSGGSSPRTAANEADADAVQREQQIADGSQYPAVTAMERRVFKGKDYASEPIVKRLERLEVAQWGKASDSTDLSDRVDRLKVATGVDPARTPPPGSDWADDEDQAPSGGGSSITYHPPVGRGGGGSSYNPEDDPMFNTRNAPRSSYAPAWGGGGGVTGGSGSYGGGTAGGGMSSTASGFGGNGNFPTGGYGYNPPPRTSAPRRIASLPPSTAAPSFPSRAPDAVSGDGMPAPAPATGLVPQIGALEQTVFGRQYTNEGLSTRLSRLEGTVFPGTRPKSDMAITERVNQLVATVGGSPSASPRVAQNPNGMPPVAPDYGGQGLPPVAPPRSGISKIINGLGSLLTGGGMGAYPMSSNLVQDPSTGYLIDTMTGNMINPTTGQVVRQGMGPVGGGYSSGFNSGLSPIGSPYGYGTTTRGSTMNFGFGGSGIRFGGGGMGMGMGGIGGYPVGTMTGW